VQLGDLLHGDLHGVLSIPPQVVDELPAIVAEQGNRADHQGVL